MNTWACVLGWGLIALGLVGCIVPVLPGPVLAYCALWVPLAFGSPLPASALWLGGAATALATLFDYVLPTFFARKFNCSKSGVTGCVLGTIVGLFFMPLGLILGPFVGTIVGELTAGRNLAEAAKGGVGAFLGFLSGIVVKLASVGFMAWLFLCGGARGL